MEASAMVVGLCYANLTSFALPTRFRTYGRSNPQGSHRHTPLLLCRPLALRLPTDTRVGSHRLPIIRFLLDFCERRRQRKG